MINPYIAVLITLLASIGLSYLMIGLTSYLGPKVTSKVKMDPFECGSEPLTPVKRRLSVKFYLIAALFGMFDIEVVFLYPWAVAFRELGILGFVEMTVFLLILGAGLAYAWRKGALETI
jgi:NADH-quinone oxidoreductase subunit A